MRPAGLAPRLLALGALALGLGAAPHVPHPPPALLALAAAGAGCLWLARHRAARTAAAAALAATAGLGLGAARVDAIDAGALRPSGEAAPTAVRGFVEAVPRRAGGEVRVRVATARGRLLVEAREPVPDLPVGREVAAAGRLRPAAEWERGYLERLGIAAVLDARRIEPTGARRGGIHLVADRVRERAELALGRGTPPAEAALLRGFVLGQDDRIDPATVADYQRSGLAHLLAVSGQNVVLLAMLSFAVFTVLGLGLRARLVGVLLLIALYVPVAGAGPSIQRAGVMGAAGAVAALAGRPSSRWFALALAAVATLMLNPRTTGEVGWQLSFAAVAGIALWAAPLRAALAPGGPQGIRRALADGAAVTLAATIATAPLMAHHFDRLSLASLAANLLALPAVAPVMWLGMLAAAAGQIPALPVEPLTALAGLCAAYITQVASWGAAPAWAEVEVALPGGWQTAAVYAALLAAGWALERRATRRRTLTGRRGWRAVAAGVALALVAAAAIGHGSRDDAPDAGLVVRFLDVGQGDAILLAPRRGDPVLVDTGTPDGAAADRLRELGVDRLSAVLVTHGDDDHAGGLSAVLAAADVEVLGIAADDPGVAGAAAAAGVEVARLAQGSELRHGGLSLEVLWPPRPLVDAGAPPPAEPNDVSLVALARWRGFSLLLPGDAEAEAAPVSPGPVDVLKLAHHGSQDAGLGPLLDAIRPALAVASVGAENPFGHPAPETTAELANHGVPLARTDAQGEVVVAASARGWTVLGAD